MSENRAVGEKDQGSEEGQGSRALVPVDRPGRELVAGVDQLPDIVHRAGQAAVFAVSVT